MPLALLLASWWDLPELRKSVAGETFVYEARPGDYAYLVTNDGPVRRAIAILDGFAIRCDITRDAVRLHLLEPADGVTEIDTGSVTKQPSRSPLAEGDTPKAECPRRLYLRALAERVTEIDTRSVTKQPSQSPLAEGDTPKAECPRSLYRRAVF